MKEKNHQLDEFFEKYRTMVIRNAYSILKDYYAAEDICQETFLRLSREMEKVPPKNVKAWLLRVSENLAIDYMRKGGKYRIDVGLDEKMLEVSEEFYADPEQILEKKEKCENKGRVLGQLKEEKPQWYEAIIMSHLEGMDNTSIGKALGVTPALVSQWKGRGKKWLREAYKKEELKKKE